MTPQKDRIRELQLAFVGTLLAGVSHEFKNHLAIIKESTGLIEDLLIYQQPDKPFDEQRIQGIIAIINDRIGLAAEMCRFLSRFSHRMDKQLFSFDVNDLLQEEVALLRRFALQKQVEIIESLDNAVPAIYNNPSLLQFAIFAIVWPALAHLKKDGRITLAAAPRGSSVKISVTVAGEKTVEKPSPWHEVLPEVATMLRAELSHRSMPDKTEEAALILPSIES